jgi:hypothetical protein
VSEHPPIQVVTFETIDQAVKDWFDKTVDAHVVHPNGERKKVSVSWSAGERWVSSRQRKGIRDANGVLILPVISIRRSGIEPTPTMSALGTETPTLQVARRISKKTNDLMNLWTKRDPGHRTPAKPVVYEVTTIPFPDRNVLTYEIQVQAQYITQMNAIIEKIFHQLDIGKSFVAPFDNDNRQPQTGVDFETRKKIDRDYVVGFFDSNISDGGNFEEFTDQERIVRFDTTIRVPAVLQLDPEGTKPSIQVVRTAFGLNFGEEQVCFVDDPEDIEKIFGPK